MSQNTFKRTTVDKFFNNIISTKVLKIPRFASLDVVGNTPGQVGNILFNNADQNFYGHDGSTWISLNGGGGGGTPTLEQVLAVGDATGNNDINFENAVVGLAANTGFLRVTTTVDGTDPVVNPGSVGHLVYDSVLGNLYIHTGGGTWEVVGGGGSIWTLDSENFIQNTAEAGVGFTDNNLVFGAGGPDSGSPNAQAVRMQFIADSSVLGGLGSFRVGRANGTQWDTRGDNSFATGLNNVALSPQATVAGGSANTVEITSDNSFIGGGTTNTIYGTTVGAFNCGILAGTSNQIVTESATNSIIGGGTTNSITANTDAVNSGIFCGLDNMITSTDTVNHSAILGGNNNSLTGNFYASSGIGCGNNNRVTEASNSFIAGGTNNVIQDSVIAGVLAGNQNFVVGGSNFSGIVAGSGNDITTASQFSAIVCGQDNLIELTAINSSIVGGITNTLTGSNSSVLGGTTNTLSGLNSSILGGTTNTLISDNSAILAGTNVVLTQDNTAATQQFRTTEGVQHQGITNMADGNLTLDATNIREVHVIYIDDSAIADRTLTLPSPDDVGLEVGQELLIKNLGTSGFNLIITTGGLQADFYPIGVVTPQLTFSLSDGQSAHLILVNNTINIGAYAGF